MKKIIYTLIMVFAVANAFSQVSETVVVGGAQKGDTNATMEILSKNGTKGFMPPRLTATQVTSFEGNLNESNKGITVFNTTDNCLQSWKGDSWSECNAISLAKFTFNCGASSIKGNYYTDRTVTVNEYLEVSVTVEKPGTFTFYTETKNGIRFYLTSIFSEASTTPQTIQIPAIGVPVAEGEITYNLYDQSGKNCCPTGANFVTNVTENKAIFSISCANTTTQGKFTENQPNINQGLVLQLNVTVPGNYALKTNVVNGMWFEGNGFVSSGSAQKIVLQAFGTPTWNTATDGKLTFSILDKTNKELGCNVDVQLESTQSAYTVDCTTGVTVAGLLIATEPSTGQNYIKIKMNVTKIGPWVIETNLINGLKFTGSGTFDSAGLLEVILYADGTPTTAGDQKYTITNKSTGAAVCSDVNVTVSPNQAVFAIGSCTNSSQTGVWKTNSQLSGASVVVTMTATQAGPYSLTASNAGVNLSAQGTAVAGTNRITFTATGKPTTGGSVSFSLVDSKLAEICSVSVTVTVSKGGKDNPGVDCLDILLDTPGTSDGEYWIKPTGYNGQSIKTFCDMANGGYTMVWSYSENTAFNTYATVGQGTIDPGMGNLAADRNFNANNYDSELVNYENFRIPLAAMKGIAPANQLKFKVRVASGVDGAKDMKDANGLANYLTSSETNLDIRYNNGIGTYYFQCEGKILGVPFQKGPYNTGYNEDLYDGQRNVGNGNIALGIYNATGYGFHLNFAAGSPLGGNPNYFGWFGEGGQEVNGHFYDCKNGQAKCDGNTSGSSGVKPSASNKVIQWFFL